jgi:50S ribosomal subunit-associated GTPase HflX
LSQQRGNGINTCGPGETQLESTAGASSVASTSSKTTSVRSAKAAVQSAQAHCDRHVAIVGYTNAASDYQPAHGAGVLVEGLFARRPTARRLARRRRDGVRVRHGRLVRKLPHQLVEAFRTLDVMVMPPLVHVVGVRPTAGTSTLSGRPGDRRVRPELLVPAIDRRRAAAAVIPRRHLV